jgi:hypothetical protein
MQNIKNKNKKNTHTEPGPPVIQGLSMQHDVV